MNLRFFTERYLCFHFYQHGTASGAVCKRIAAWVRDYTRDELEFFALHMPTAPWKKLADICHFNPKKVLITFRMALYDDREYSS